MLAGLFAARNVAGAQLDLWSINEDQSFHEEVDHEGKKPGGVSDRLTPARVERGIEDVLRTAFARYDETALGGAVAITASLTLALVTAATLLGPSDAFAPMLSLLGNLLFGYVVSWPGLAIGMVEAGAIGFGLGWLTAKLINLLTSVFERNLERRLATLTTLEAVEGGSIERR
jgi:hypothetical protein